MIAARRLVRPLELNAISGEIVDPAMTVHRSSNPSVFVTSVLVRTIMLSSH
jgi:hypothetical protein